MLSLSATLLTKQTIPGYFQSPKVIAYSPYHLLLYNMYLTFAIALSFQLSTIDQNILYALARCRFKCFAFASDLNVFLEVMGNMGIFMKHPDFN